MNTLSSKLNLYYMPSFSFTRAESLSFCLFLLGATTEAVSTNGPDHVCIGAFEYEKFVELNGTSGGSKTGSMWCEEPNG